MVSHQVAEKHVGSFQERARRLPGVKAPGSTTCISTMRGTDFLGSQILQVTTASIHMGKGGVRLRRCRVGATCCAGHVPEHIGGRRPSSDVRRGHFVKMNTRP